MICARCGRKPKNSEERFFAHDALLARPYLCPKCESKWEIFFVGKDLQRNSDMKVWENMFAIFCGKDKERVEFT